MSLGQIRALKYGCLLNTGACQILVILGYSTVDLGMFIQIKLGKNMIE